MARDETDLPDAIRQLLTPEIVLPEQLACPSLKGRGAGERALMLAVLEDAIRCVRDDRRPTPQRLVIARETEAWMRAEEPGWPFSFVSICDALGIDAGALRRSVLTRGAARPVPQLRLRMKPRAGGIRLAWRRRRAASPCRQATSAKP